MRVIVIGLFLATALLGTAAEAQTVAGRIPAVWDAEYGVYTYGPLYWDVDVAPSSAASDEFSLYLYYNKRAAFMSAVVACRIAGKTIRELCPIVFGRPFSVVDDRVASWKRVRAFPRLEPATWMKSSRTG